MTLNQVIYSIRNLIKDAKSDDVKISDKQFEFIINYIRARLISQELDKGKTISENIKQDLGIINLIKVDSAESESLTAGLTILRTDRPLPSVIELNYKDCLVYVGGIDKYSPFQFTTKAYAHRVKDSKYAKKIAHAYIKDDYIYVVSPTNLIKYINVQGVFEDPRFAWEFNVDNSFYDPGIDEYPLSTRMVETLGEMIITKDLNMFFQIGQDNKNNASSDDSQPQLKGQTQDRYGYKE